MERIDALMKEYFDTNKKLNELKSKIDLIKSELKMELKQNAMETHSDTFGNFVSYKTQSRKSLDKSLVRDFIGNDEDFNNCFKETSFEILRVMSKEQLQNVKKFTKKK